MIPLNSHARRLPSARNLVAEYHRNRGRTRNLLIALTLSAKTSDNSETTAKQSVQIHPALERKFPKTNQLNSETGNLLPHLNPSLSFLDLRLRVVCFSVSHANKKGSRLAPLHANLVYGLRT